MPCVAKKNHLTELLLEAQKGSDNSFSLAVKNITPALRNFIRRKGIPFHDVDDVLQETLISIANSLQSFNPKKANGVTWCHVIAARKSVDSFRRKMAKKKIVIENTNVVEWKVDETPKQNVGFEDVAKIIDYLPEDEKDIITLHYGKGKTMKQVAAILGMPEGTVKCKAHRTIKLFRKTFATEN